MQDCLACPSLEGEAYRCRFQGASVPDLPAEWQDPGETQQKAEVCVDVEFQLSACQ